ncbi:hypothetical protein, partial [Micromonospora sp. LOL_023]|uniref:hypothetical protein n=1 Tax=Micromonospora sp. LOL_023 TaxID=3345418 RepID=UPI003A87254B
MDPHDTRQPEGRGGLTVAPDTTIPGRPAFHRAGTTDQRTDDGHSPSTRRPLTDPHRAFAYSVQHQDPTPPDRPMFPAPG